MSKRGPALVLIVAGVAACSRNLLDEGFEDPFVQGYACGDAWVVLANEAQTVRAQFAFEGVVGPVPQDERMSVITGVRLVRRDDNPCDDGIQVRVRDQRVDCHYEQIAGSVTAQIDEDVIRVTMEDVVLTTLPINPVCGQADDLALPDDTLPGVRITRRWGDVIDDG